MSITQKVGGRGRLRPINCMEGTMEIKSYSIWEALHMPTGTRVVLASECGRQLDALKCALLSERARLTSGSREMHEFDERCQVFGLAPWTWKPYVLAQQAEGGMDDAD